MDIDAAMDAIGRAIKVDDAPKMWAEIRKALAILGSHAQGWWSVWARCAPDFKGIRLVLDCAVNAGAARCFDELTHDAFDPARWGQLPPGHRAQLESLFLATLRGWESAEPSQRLSTHAVARAVELYLVRGGKKIVGVATAKLADVLGRKAGSDLRNAIDIAVGSLVSAEEKQRLWSDTARPSELK